LYIPSSFAKIAENMILQNILFRQHLDTEEKLLFVVHKHWIEILKPSVQTALFGILIPWTLYFFLPSILLWPAVFWFFSFWVWYMYHVIDWYFDAWLVTDRSLIDIEWFGIFHQTSTRISYTEVREIQWEINGFLGTLLQFGNASISMATGGKVTLHNVSKPKKRELQIIEIRDEFLSHQKMMQSEALQELLSNMLTHHIEQKGLQNRSL
jgi:hypothetical protein